MSANSNFPFEDLSKREMQVLQELANGVTREELAAKLGITVLTYDGYRKSIRNKLRIKNQMDWSRVLLQIEQHIKPL